MKFHKIPSLHVWSLQRTPVLSTWNHIINPYAPRAEIIIIFPTYEHFHLSREKLRRVHMESKSLNYWTNENQWKANFQLFFVKFGRLSGSILVVLGHFWSIFYKNNRSRSKTAFLIVWLISAILDWNWSFWAAHIQITQFRRGSVIFIESDTINSPGTIVCWTDIFPFWAKIKTVIMASCDGFCKKFLSQSIVHEL